MFGAIRHKLRNVLLGKPATSDYRQSTDLHFQRPRDLPPFNFATIRSMLMDPTIRLGLAMRSAPLYQAEFAFKEPDSSEAGFKWTPGVKADTPEVGKFVHRQLLRIWATSLHKILLAQTWGWSAGEVTYKLSADKMIEFDGILHRHARDVLALRQAGEVKGVQFRSLKGGIGRVDLLFPKSYWHVYDPEAESAYSMGALIGAYSPWADKWLNGGALDVRRLFAVKDAYGGVDIAYPSGNLNIEGKGEIPARDIAREIGEQIKAGASTTRPSDVDPTTGKEKWLITRASIPANPVHIFDYPKQLDIEMLRGLEIPDDVLTSEGGVGLQGNKDVPMQAFFTNADRWLTQVVAMLVPQILEDLVMLDWGHAIGFEVTTKPLAEQAMDQTKGEGGPAQGMPQGPPQLTGEQGGVRRPGAESVQGGEPRRFSLDDSNTSELLVGQGVVEASHLVEAGRRYLDNGGIMPVRLSQQNTEVDLRQELVDACQFSPGYKKIFLRMTNGSGNGVKRLAVTHAPKGGVSVGGKKFKGGEFIPGDVLEKATEKERAAIEGKKTGKAAPPTDKRASADKLKKKFEQLVTDNPLHKGALSDRLQTTVRDSVRRISANMPEKAAAQIESKVKHLAVLNTNQLSELRARIMGPGKVPEGVVLGGFYGFGSGIVAVEAPKKSDNILRDNIRVKRFKGTLAHEMGHALDDAGNYSQSREWQNAWQEDIRDGNVLLSDYAKTDAMEGFAEMVRAYYSEGEPQSSMLKLFPNAAAFFEDKGLI